MFVQETRHLPRADVLPGFQKASSEYTDGVGMGLHEVSHDFCELDLVLQ